MVASIRTGRYRPTGARLHPAVVALPPPTAADRPLHEETVVHRQRTDPERALVVARLLPDASGHHLEASVVVHPVVAKAQTTFVEAALAPARLLAGAACPEVEASVPVAGVLAEAALARCRTLTDLVRPRRGARSAVPVCVVEAVRL